MKYLSEKLLNANFAADFKNSEPYSHIVIDDFFNNEIADALASEFPPFDSSLWYNYNNAIEKKRAMNSWDRFPKTTYSVFTYLNSPQFISTLQRWTDINALYPDVGLHGGGWHAHGRDGKLNVHLDYSLHPKLKLERKLNLIVYMSKGWRKEWGGGLQLWSHDGKNNSPLRCEKIIENKFNRAVLFDTTQNSWHGLPDPLDCPQGQIRQSLAIYYLTQPHELTPERPKALFAPNESQKNDAHVLELINQRSGLETAAQSYRDDENYKKK
jgi:hypothetical protein